VCVVIDVLKCIGARHQQYYTLRSHSRYTKFSTISGIIKCENYCACDTITYRPFLGKFTHAPVRGPSRNTIVGKRWLYQRCVLYLLHSAFSAHRLKAVPEYRYGSQFNELQTYVNTTRVPRPGRLMSLVVCTALRC